jgi:hypothetical protein
MKIFYLVLALLTSFWIPVKAQWSATSGPIRPAVCFAKNSSYIFTGTSSVSTSDGVFRTSNQGSSWTAVNNDGVSSNIADIICVGEAVLAAQDNQIFLSLDNGDNWSSVSSNIGSYPITCLAKRGTEVFAAGQGLYYSNNLGLTWSTLAAVGNTGSGNSGLAVFGDTVFVGKTTGGLWRSINGGTTFSSVSTGLSGTSVTNVVQKGNVHYVGSSTGIFRSTNGGTTWQLASVNVTYVSNIIVAQDILFAASENGVFFSFDEGMHWFAANDGLLSNQATTIFSDDQFLYAGVSQSSVFKRALSDFTQPIDTCNVVVYDTTNVTIFDTTEVVQIDTNYIDVYDTTFVTQFDTIVVNQFDTTYVSVFDTTFVTEFDTIVTNIFDTTQIAIYDTVLISVDDTLTINTQITTGNESFPVSIKVYPNPASYELNIESSQYSILNTHQIKIYNNLGQLVFEQNFTENPLTSFIGSWGGSGIYFLHLVDQTGNSIEIKKIVLQN